MKISGNTLLITGGTSGIGLAFALEFLKEGNTVIICGRRKDRLNELQEKHPGIIIKTCDVANEGQRKELFTWAIENHPDINVFINNAGIQLLTDMTMEVDLERVRSEVEVNFIAPVHLASLFASHLKLMPHAVIINISSGLAFVPIAFMPVYCATKAAVHSITLSLRHQLKDAGIKVFEIIPPSVDTELGHDRRKDKSQSHGGMPITDFINEAMEALKADIYEAPIAQSKNLHTNRETMFEIMNQH